MPVAPKPSTTDLDDALARLGLRPDGAVFSSLTSLLRPVTLDGQPALLKVTNEPEELDGTHALQAWHGQGAVRVLARQGNAIVLERAGSPLRAVVTQDEAATRALCSVAERLHSHTPEVLDPFPTLRNWFASLFTDTTARFDQVRTIAEKLLEHPSRPVLLHGDLHHDNVLDGADRGWLAIDAKGIVGPREFDYCHLFTNWAPQHALTHFDARRRIVAATANIAHAHLLRWIAAWSALSGMWHLEDGDPARAAFPHAITDLALERLEAHHTPGDTPCG